MGADEAGTMLTVALMLCSAGYAAPKDGRGWHQQKARCHLQNRPSCTSGAQLAPWPISLCSHACCTSRVCSSPPDSSSSQTCQAPRCMTLLKVISLLHQPLGAHISCSVWALPMPGLAAVLHTPEWFGGPALPAGSDSFVRACHFAFRSFQRRIWCLARPGGRPQATG